MKTLLASSSVVVASLLLASPAAADPRTPRVATAERGVPAVATPPAPALAAPEEEPPRRARRDAAEERRHPRDQDDEPAEDGFSFGARLGYAIPMGSIAKDTGIAAPDLSRTAAGMVPIWADAGYRINPRWYVGGYFQLGIVNTAGDFCKREAGEAACSSSGTDLRFGLFAKHTFKPNAKVSPWIGVSTGYEILNVSVTSGKATADQSVRGFEFIGMHLGADFHVADEFTIGPMVMASFGQYSSYSWTAPKGSGSSDFTNTALHEWVSFGIRGQFDL